MMLPVLAALFMPFLNEETNRMNDTTAMLYLQQYGYLDMPPENITLSRNHLTMKPLRQAISEFQSFAGLDVTGELNQATVALMRLPRCGVKDVISSPRRQKRYDLHGSKWSKGSNLKYRITSFPRTLSRNEAIKEIDRAFKVWSEHTNLNFIPAKVFENVDIEIRFEFGDHGDEDPFDGPGGTLAHASFPLFGGDVHFDASEAWTSNSYRGINLFQTAVHEIGHSLGLDHSSVRKAVMAPFYQGYTPSFHLHRDDIQGIQTLYGKRRHTVPSSSPITPRTTTTFRTTSATTTTTTTTTTTENASKVRDSDEVFLVNRNGGLDDEDEEPYASKPDPYLCIRPRIDTIFNGPDGSTYVFRYSKYWKLKDKMILSGYPKLISQRWPGIVGYVDAAFTANNGKTFIFKGSKFWKYHGHSLLQGYPKKIYKGFPGIPNNIDAALNIKNGTVFFFKEDNVWRFTPTDRPSVNAVYPKPITEVFKGGPAYVDAALQNNEDIFLFRGDDYYEIDSASFSIRDDEQSFPRDMQDDWFGCTRNTPVSDDNWNDKTGHTANYICHIPRIDTIFKASNGTIYAFYGKRFWSASKLENFYQVEAELIAEMWPELSGDIDAAFMARNNKTYFFKGSNYWRYDQESIGEINSESTLKDTSEYFDADTFTLLGDPDILIRASKYLKNNTSNENSSTSEHSAGFHAVLSSNGQPVFETSNYWRRKRDIKKQIIEGYPKSISKGFSGIPDNLDTILAPNFNATIYVFKGNKVWEYNSGNRPPVEEGFPKKIRYIWKQIPSDVDAAFQDNGGDVYFFKGRNYYKLSDTQFYLGSVTATETGSISSLFGCKSPLRTNNYLNF